MGQQDHEFLWLPSILASVPPVCNRILSKDQILVSCSHMTCYLQNLHYISITCFIDVFNQGVIKDPKIK